MKTWRHAIHDAAITGSLAGVATAACAAICGKLESGSALAPLNAVSHVLWGSRAANVETATLTETVPGLAINEGASLFWATCYEKGFGELADRGNVGPAVLGGAAVAMLAYLTDYHLVPKRLTPGWEHRVSKRSLAVIYVALAASLPLRGLLASRRQT
jgi:hypothetical protein